MTSTILLTGFGPFPGAPFNPTGPLVRELARRNSPGLRRAAHVFTTSYQTVDRELPAEALLRAARGVDRKFVTEIRLFDVYEGAGLAEGKKSLAITVVLQPQERTLTDAEIEGFSKRLIAQIEKATGGQLRG